MLFVTFSWPSNNNGELKSYAGLWLDGKLMMGLSTDIEDEVDAIHPDLFAALAENLANGFGASFCVRNLETSVDSFEELSRGF